jgi:hypothetical protein
MQAANRTVKASHGIGGGEIRKSQKACESSTLSARTMFCSGVELLAPEIYQACYRTQL